MPYTITPRWDGRWQILYPSGRVHSTHRERWQAVHELRSHVLAIGAIAAEVQNQIRQERELARVAPIQNDWWRPTAIQISPGQARLLTIVRNQPGRSLGHYAHARGVTRERVRQLMQTLQQRRLTERAPNGKWRATEHAGACQTCGQPWTDGRINPTQCNPCRRNLGEWPTLNNGDQP
jgi:hypothetical protein